ncbi:MAG: PSD1 and planctomycete cytochrome C domain-containing protein [Bryobacteraceae bacterium]
MRCLLLTLLLAPLLHSADDKAQEFFEMRVRPVLAKNCFACHTGSKMGGLEMRSRESLLKGGKSGPAVTSGDPDHSLLVQAIRQQGELKMPPQGRLKDEEIEQIAAWVKSGAVWPDAPTAPAAKAGEYIVTPEQRAFWSFQPIRKPALPNVEAKTPIDRFIVAKLHEKGLEPVKPADKRTLIRRATYDLTGLPPTPEEIDAFLADKSSTAFEKVVDRLLVSPHYGERWGRHWLDVARYSDDKLDPTGETPHPNAFRYRDWVIHAFNHDMPYDLFVKAQIAGDQLPEPAKTAAGLGLYALSPEFQDDRVDVTTRGFLALTVACAQCHNHKFDPIPQTDYYSILGIFNNTKMNEFPLAPGAVVDEYKARKKKADDQQTVLETYVRSQGLQLAQIHATHTADYLMAVRKDKLDDREKNAAAAGLDLETLNNWIAYVRKPKLEHPYLKPFLDALAANKPEAEVRKIAEDFQALALEVFTEKKTIDDKNYIRLGGSSVRSDLSSADLLSLERDKYFLWRDLYDTKGVLIYGENGIARFLSGEFRTYLKTLRQDLDRYTKEIPEQYPYLQIISDADSLKKQKLFIRGDRNNLGDEVPPRNLTILCNGGPPKVFTKGSGRLELAEAIASPDNPLTARVMVNRIWQSHFGTGIVRTTSNFGQLGERPVNPELLDYLAARFIENKWSIKAMNREIMLTSTYQLSTDDSPKAFTADPENRLLWRANRTRLDIEELRDSLLFVSGKLDPKTGGPPEHLTVDNKRRTVYGFVSRKDLDPLLALFDFPNPNATSEQRIVTTVPLQGLFFLNSPLIIKETEALAERIGSTGDQAASIQKTYRLLFGRAPTAQELALGTEFLKSNKDQPWPKYLQVLLSSNEFIFIG